MNVRIIDAVEISKFCWAMRGLDGMVSAGLDITQVGSKDQCQCIDHDR